jgi:hypothetical protein
LSKDSPQLADSLAPIGLSLLQQKKIDQGRTAPPRMLGLSREAEPPLLKGYEGMKQREATIPKPGNVTLTEALDRLIKLYSATNKPHEVQMWQVERAEYPAAASTSPTPR